MNADLHLSRARLYVLIQAFEQDIRSALEKYVVSELGAETALGPNFDVARTRMGDDGLSGDNAALVDYLDLRPAYDLLNAHRALLPSAFASEVRELTPNLDRLVAIRNRVMHSRPLVAGDAETAGSLLAQYAARQWEQLQRSLARLGSEPSWEPEIGPTEDHGYALHNLPLPDYDETGLVGRDREVAALVTHLKRGREPVHTITGEGGIGKTAAALQVAYELVDDPERTFDAVLWATLKYEKLTTSGVVEIADAARDLLGALAPVGRAVDTGFSGSVTDLAVLLADLKVLCVIDNLETVSGSEFSKLYEKLPSTVTYLLTSRLGVGEFERRHPLSPLAESESLRLFNDLVRTRSVGAISRVSRETRIEVVRRLRHSPLAIKWFVLSVEAGNDPLHVVRNQEDLLDFCVRSVFDALSDVARSVLHVLKVTGKPTPFDELVFLLDSSPDPINLGVQELLRGSLVTRQTGSAESLAQTITLTDTARQYLDVRGLGSEIEQALNRQITEFNNVAARRVVDIGKRSMDPIIVHLSSKEDESTAQFLRRALLASKRQDFPGALASIDLARRLNPECWEVDRVEAFVRQSRGEAAVATSLYERAYEAALGEDRAVVAHFFAGHLARNVKDLNRAVRLAREAHGVMGTDETAVALGTFLCWSHDFEGAAALVEPAVARMASGRGKLIALGVLVQIWLRWSESASEDERNPARGFSRAVKGHAIVVASLESGIADSRLRDGGAKCVAAALRCARESLSAGLPVRGLADWLQSLSENVALYRASSLWVRIEVSALELSKVRGCPQGALRLAEAVRAISSASRDAETPGGVANLVHAGRVFSCNERYGFIRAAAFPTNVFFHATDLVGVRFEDLLPGDDVRFETLESDRGTRAARVRRA